MLFVVLSQFKGYFKQNHILQRQIATLQNPKAYTSSSPTRRPLRMFKKNSCLAEKGGGGGDTKTGRHQNRCERVKLSRGHHHVVSKIPLTEHPRTYEHYGDVAQLVERRTGTPLTQVRFPGAARDFQCRISYGVRKPPVMQWHALTSVRTLKIL